MHNVRNFKDDGNSKPQGLMTNLRLSELCKLTAGILMIAVQSFLQRGSEQLDKKMSQIVLFDNLFAHDNSIESSTLII